MKRRIETEDFSGKTAISVKQDFHAKVFLMSLCAIYTHPIDEKVREEYKADENRRHARQINRTNALSMTREILASVFLKYRFGIVLETFDRIVEKTWEVIRSGCSVERKKKSEKLFSMNYKKL